MISRSDYKRVQWLFMEAQHDENLERVLVAAATILHELGIRAPVVARPEPDARQERGSRDRAFRGGQDRSGDAA